MKIVAALTAILGFAAPVAAAPIAVTSYNMPNGSGQASGGTYNYWDLAYNGAGGDQFRWRSAVGRHRRPDRRRLGERCLV